MDKENTPEKIPEFKKIFEFLTTDIEVKKSEQRIKEIQIKSDTELKKKALELEAQRDENQFKAFTMSREDNKQFRNKDQNLRIGIIVSILVSCLVVLGFGLYLIQSENPYGENIISHFFALAAGFFSGFGIQKTFTKQAKDKEDK